MANRSCATDLRHSLTSNYDNKIIITKPQMEPFKKHFQIMKGCHGNTVIESPRVPDYLCLGSHVESVCKILSHYDTQCSYSSLGLSFLFVYFSFLQLNVFRAGDTSNNSTLSQFEQSLSEL